MHRRRQGLGRGHPVPQGDGDRDDPLADGNPGNDLRDQVSRRVGHAPPGTRRTKPPPLAAEGQQQLLVAGVTAEPQKAMDQDAALQVVIKFALDIGGQTCGSGIGVERGEKGLEMIRNHVIEDRLTRIAWFIGRNSRRHGAPYVSYRGEGDERERHRNIVHINSRRHGAPYVSYRGEGDERERHRNIVHICTLYKHKIPGADMAQHAAAPPAGAAGGAGAGRSPRRVNAPAGGPVRAAPWAEARVAPRRGGGAEQPPPRDSAQPAPAAHVPRRGGKPSGRPLGAAAQSAPPRRAGGRGAEATRAVEKAV